MAAKLETFDDPNKGGTGYMRDLSKPVMSQTDAEFRELFEKPKRDAVALFKNNHDNGDTAIYQFISDIIPLLKARDAAVRIDQLQKLKYHDKFTPTFNVGGIVYIDQCIDELRHESDLVRSKGESDE